MKNLWMMISVALLVLGVVYVVKHRRMEVVQGPAFNSGLPIDAQPSGPYDGEYTLTSAICPGKSSGESKVPESLASRIKMRGMTAKMFRKSGSCEIAQTLQIIPTSESPNKENLKVFQLKQDRLECPANCPCFAQITGSVFVRMDLSKREIWIDERVRSEKELCKGKLPVTLKYTASSGA